MLIYISLLYFSCHRPKRRDRSPQDVVCYSIISRPRVILAEYLRLILSGIFPSCLCSVKYFRLTTQLCENIIQL